MAVFAAVVECGTFTAAAEHLVVGKSQVSQRIARLEKRLGMRLIQRTTRQQHITDFGQTYYRHCRDMLSAAERAQKLADQASDTAAGSVRAVCPRCSRRWCSVRSWLHSCARFRMSICILTRNAGMSVSLGRAMTSLSASAITSMTPLWLRARWGATITTDGESRIVAGSTACRTR